MGRSRRSRCAIERYDNRRHIKSGDAEGDCAFFCVGCCVRVVVAEYLEKEAGRAGADSTTHMSSGEARVNRQHFQASARLC